MKKEQKVFLTVKHHRRPRSLGGLTDESNIAQVDPDKHVKWHLLFNNMNAFQICERINSFPWKPEGVTIICKFINGEEVKKEGSTKRKDMEKYSTSWKILFSENFQEAINHINNVWLDPSYHLYVRKNKNS